MDDLIPIIGILSAVALPLIVGGYVLIYFLRSRNKERMELIKQGIIPAAQLKAAPNKYSMLRNGCLFIGIALGLLTGLLVDDLLSYGSLGSLIIMTSTTLLFLGLSYIVFYLLVKNKLTDEE